MLLLQLWLVFGEGRTFRGEVRKFALANTVFAINPQEGGPDSQTDTTASRKQLREQAVIRASRAPALRGQAASLGDTMSTWIDATSMASILTLLQNHARQLSRFEQ